MNHSINKLMRLVLILLMVAHIVFLGEKSSFATQTSNSNLQIESANCGGDLSTPEKVLAYLLCHKNDIALANYSVGPNGSPDTNEPTIMHNANVKMPLASTIKIILLAAYAKEVEAGRMNPDQTLSVGDWERNFIPVVDGGAHRNALQALGIATDEFGFALDQQATITLDQLVASMIHFSDNAGPDWLLEHIGEDDIRAVLREASMTKQDLPLFASGFFLSLNNHEDGPLTVKRLERLLRLQRSAYERKVRHLHDLFQQPEWKQAEFEWLLNVGISEDRVLIGKAFDALYPKGTVREYARLMAKVVTGTFISPEVSATMRRHLEWPMQLPGVSDVFIAFGNKGGSWEGGYITDANFYIPRMGDFAGRPRVTVLFMRRMPLADFDLLSLNGIEQIFEAKLAVERSFALRVRRLFHLCETATETSAPAESDQQ